MFNVNKYFLSPGRISNHVIFNRNGHNQISQELRSKVNKTQARVIDFCSGVGMSTRALEKVRLVSAMQ
jgi:hypothetical protein